MLFISVLATWVLVATAQQISIKTPPFDLVDETLPVSYGNVSVSPPGRLLPLSVPVDAPRIGVPSGVTNKGPFLLITIDPDSSRPYVLHWLQPNLIPSANNSLVPLNNTPALAAYRNPRPPAGDKPHRYIFLLFNQPANFTIPPDFASFIGPEGQRPGFNFSQFVAETGLKKPVAANYFLAQNSTTVTNTTTGSGSNATGARTSAVSRATVSPYTGEAGTSFHALPLTILSGLFAIMVAGLA